MTLPKFIITMDGVFRLGMVNQHKDLLKSGDQCIGGGYYHFDYITNRILLDRESYDFGRPKWHLLDTLKVPSPPCRAAWRPSVRMWTSLSSSLSSTWN